MPDLVDGYLDGLADDRVEAPSSLANRSPIYRFGWLNGRDDRIRQPRKTAKELREELAELENQENSNGQDSS